MDPATFDAIARAFARGVTRRRLKAKRADRREPVPHAGLLRAAFQEPSYSGLPVETRVRPSLGQDERSRTRPEIIVRFLEQGVGF